MKFLDYVRVYNTRTAAHNKQLPAVGINLITNFTDAVLQKVLTGACLSLGLNPNITAAPYKQYPMVLKQKSAQLYTSKPDISFLFFDINPYIHGAFHESPLHIDEVLEDIRVYAGSTSGMVVVSLAILPYHSTYGHFFAENPLFIQIKKWNDSLLALSKELPNLTVFDTNKIVHRLGEAQVRDMRGLYAFDTPFSNDFLVALSEEWLSIIASLKGKSRKCIVLDLDNTLWGGVVGETGPLGVVLGPTYPGVAFQNFQRALLSLWGRGVILAISSKNNLADAMEVFKKNPYMVLKEEHFAAIECNWEEKSINIDRIAKELNIGSDSMVFIDDSPLEREKVRMQHPEVLVPEVGSEPEAMISALFSLNVFHQLAITEEDKKKGLMYAQERQRKVARTSSTSEEEYIASLGIKMSITCNDLQSLPRLAQLTQKTNQFNLTTHRYSESDLTNIIKQKGLIFSADVTDKFGEYGTVIEAIVMIDKKGAELDTFLMSCRVMGRKVEFGFLTHIAEELKAVGVEELSATYIPTAKNTPIKTFLPDAGFTLEKKTKDGSEHYTLNIKKYLQTLTKSGKQSTITITKTHV